MKFPTSAVDRSRLGPRLGEGRTAEVFAWDDGRVAKLYRTGWTRETVVREATATDAVTRAGGPAPAVRELIEVDGRFGLVLDRLEGGSMLDVLGARPWRVVGVARQLAELQLRIHDLAAVDLPDQREWLTEAINRAAGVDAAVRTRALSRLMRLLPGDHLSHGDFHPDNVIITDAGPIVIDWSEATRGNPIADAALTSLLLRLAEPGPGSGRAQRIMIAIGRRLLHWAYRRRYLELRPGSEPELAAWQLPVAVARLAAGIEPERARLMDHIARLRAG